MLSLEPGLCSYGNNIDETTTSVEAGLIWTIGKKRKQNENFTGARIIMPQLKEGVEKKRIGLVNTNGPPARNGAFTVNSDDKIVGRATSGCPDPSLSLYIAVANVNVDYFKSGVNVYLKIREKLCQATV